MEKNIKNLFPPILVVEDNEDHARLIIRTLKKANLMNAITHLKNGEEAINFLRKEENYSDNEQLVPMLILLDVKMPLKNGFQVLEVIKSDDKLKEIPVVMLTTTSSNDDIAKAMRMGANDYIVKPVKFTDFTEKVSKLGYYWGVISDAKELFNS